MSKRFGRREFVRRTTAAGVAAAAIPKTLFGQPSTGPGQAPVMMTAKGVKPCVVASSNGNRSKDDKGVTCVAKAFKMMADGADVLDALVAGVAIVELDPNQTGVGWSGLPNAEGVVQLDASCMHGPKKRAGAVAAIEGVRTPGRAGDSPILGAGLYVDGDIGAAGSTGRGESNLYNLSSFVIVEEMRRGAHPKDAAMTALRRVAKNTIEKRLLNDKGQPNFGLNFYCLNAKGEYAGVAMYESTYAVWTENGPQTLETDALYEGRATD